MALTIDFFSYYNTLLGFFLASPFLVAFFIAVQSSRKANTFGVVGSIIIFWLSVLIFFGYCFLFNNYILLDFVNDVYITKTFIRAPQSYNIEIGVDTITLLFSTLTTFIFLLTSFIIFEYYFEERIAAKVLYVLFFVMEGFVLLAFFTLSMFFFYIFFEAVLLPMYLIIIIWGSRLRKIKAAYLFFMYTVFFSFFFLYSLLLMYDSIDFVFWFDDLSDGWALLHKDFYQQNFIWVCFFLALAVKVPVFPLHVWLPEAHVEAPTFGSIILASILLKLGGYGFLRFLLPLFPDSTLYFRPLVLVLALVGTVYGSFMAIIQVDLKKVIAYSSVAHMNLGVLGLFTLTYEGLLGSLFLFISHGFTSAALFFLVGILYRRYHTRLVAYYSGLGILLPIWSFYLLFFLFANIGFPGTLSFISELLIFFSVLDSSFGMPILVILFIPFIGSLVYSIWTHDKIALGSFSVYIEATTSDVTEFEYRVLFLLAYFTVFFGIFFSIISDLVIFDLLYLSSCFFV